MRMDGWRKLLLLGSACGALLWAGPARAHSPSGSTPQNDGTYTWQAWGDLSSPADGATFMGPLNVTVSSNSSHKVTVTGPANAGISVTYSMWVENDWTQVGNGKSATNLAVNLSGVGLWEEPASRSGTANGVTSGSHSAAATASITVAGAFNYGAVVHQHGYSVF